MAVNKSRLVQALEVFELIENYEEDSDKAVERKGFWKKERPAGGEEEPEGYEVAPTAKEYGSMLHILSKSKDVRRGANWERSMELLREAQEHEFPISESSFQTGVYEGYWFGAVGWTRPVPTGQEIQPSHTAPGMMFCLGIFWRSC